VFGKKLGIFGLGVIGRKVASRAANGFEMEVAYHNRQPAPDVPYTWMPTLLELAAWADFLVVTAPGGDATRHSVNREVLAALGPNGYLVNVGRGTTVDTDALVAALESGQVAGAGLDVVEGEPNLPPGLLAADHVVLTPHFAGRSPESAQAAIDMLATNLGAWFTGKPVRNRVA
jgi:lactate dehydrogenase-like 2-hydroxyacid dehydrogenase